MTTNDDVTVCSSSCMGSGNRVRLSADTTLEGGTALSAPPPCSG